MAASSNPGMAYLHLAFGGNITLLRILTSELPDGVFAQVGGRNRASSGRNGTNRSGGRKKNSSNGNNKSNSSKKVGREFLPTSLTNAMASKSRAQYYSETQNNFLTAQTEHDKRYNDFVSKCYEKRGQDRSQANARIRAVKEKVKNGKSLDAYGYESDTQDDDDDIFPDSQEVAIMGILKAREIMNSAKTNFDDAHDQIDLARGN